MTSRRLRRERQKKWRTMLSHKNAYGVECELAYPHFVPPSFGQVGFYSCNPPADLTNHTRCRPPFDHEHLQHVVLPSDPYAAPEEMARRREMKDLGRSRVIPYPYDRLVVAARALLSEAAVHTDPKIGWSGWPEEYAALARACDWRAPAGWNEES